jgi:hypothetical protein
MKIVGKFSSVRDFLKVGGEFFLGGYYLMKSRTDWKHAADDACAEAEEAGDAYATAKQELDDAREAESQAHREAEAARKEVESTRAEVRANREELISARATLHEARDEERVAARAALAGVEAVLADAGRNLLDVEHRLREAERMLHDAEQRSIAAERTVSMEQNRVEHARSGIEDLISSARKEFSRGDGYQVRVTPHRRLEVRDDFVRIQQAHDAEPEFYREILGQLEETLYFLDSTVEAANRPHISASPDFGGITGGRCVGFTGLPSLPGFGSGWAAPAPGAGLGGSTALPGFGAAGGLPGWGIMPAPVPAMNSVGLGTVPQSYSPSWAYRQDDHMFLAFSTGSPPGALPLLGTTPAPAYSYLELQLSTSGRWTPPLSFETVPKAYSLAMGTSSLSLGHSAFEYAPPMSISPPVGGSLSICSGGGSSMGYGGFGGGFSFGFGGVPALGS